MKVDKASDALIFDFLKVHGQWTLKNGKLHKKFVFNDFIETFGFMTRVALVAEKLNHHPEWCNVYNQVTVDLITHEAAGITHRDFTLAQAMDELSMSESQKPASHE